jgi:hypothetical protein
MPPKFLAPIPKNFKLKHRCLAAYAEAFPGDALEDRAVPSAQIETELFSDFEQFGLRRFGQGQRLKISVGSPQLCVRHLDMKDVSRVRGYRRLEAFSARNDLAGCSVKGFGEAEVCAIRILI